MVKVESKAPVPPFRGTAAPASLSIPHPGYSLEDTKEAALLRTVLSRALSGKQYRFRLATTLTASSSAGGILNATISNSTLASNVEFVALSSVFNEFFVKSMATQWEPVSMYNYPLTGVTATSVSSLPLGVADLQHDASAYTSQSVMSQNFRYAHHNTGRPFSYSWLNVESPTSTVLDPSPAGTAGFQAWALTAAVANYGGSIQYLTQSAPPGLPASQQLGVFLVEWDVLFRVRM